jgi:hypothetical protein
MEYSKKSKIVSFESILETSLVSKKIGAATSGMREAKELSWSISLTKMLIAKSLEINHSHEKGTLNRYSVRWLER